MVGECVRDRCVVGGGGVGGGVCRVESVFVGGGGRVG